MALGWAARACLLLVALLWLPPIQPASAAVSITVTTLSLSPAGLGNSVGNCVGLDLPELDAGLGVLLVIGAAALLRFVIETVAAHWYPKRLLAVAPEDIESTPDWRRWITLVVEIGCFTFFAASYMGTSPWLWLGTALVFASVTMDDWADLLPDWPALAKLIPGGIIGMLFYFLLGTWAGVGFRALVDDPAKVAQIGFVVLMIPGFICSVVAATSRNGDGWSLNWPIRWAGIPMLVLTALVVTGAVAVT